LDGAISFGPISPSLGVRLTLTQISPVVRPGTPIFFHIVAAGRCWSSSTTGNGRAD
jgi:hypothetical protein